MKFISIYIFALLLIGGDLSKSNEKKARKAIKKAFDTELILMKEVSVEGNLLDRPGPGFKFFELHEEEDLRGYLCITTAKGRHDYFDYLAIFNPDHSIRHIEILEYRSEHGYEISNKRWLSQFEGRMGCDLVYGEDIDAISGATYSAASITEDIGILCKFLIIHFTSEIIE